MLSHVQHVPLAGEDVEVLLTKIKICDFGFAKRFTAGASEFHEGNIGTHAYQAPELIRICTGSSSAPYNERCDVWSLGVICYILLCGAFPFDVRPPVHELNRKICTGAYSFNKPAFSTVTQEGKDFISALLTVDPAKRPTAADALQHGWITGTPELALNARCPALYAGGGGGGAPRAVRKKVRYFGPVFSKDQGDRGDYCVPIRRTAQIFTQPKRVR